MNLNKFLIGSKLGTKIVWSKLIRKPFPFWAWLYITNRCNLNCSYCFVAPYWDHAKDLTFGELCKVIDELKEMGVVVVTLLGGEPTMRKDFGEIVEYLYAKKMIIDVVTNGFFLQKWVGVLPKISSICISIDGNEEMTDSVRGKGVYKKAIEALKLAKNKGVPVRIHGVITKQTIRSLPEMAALCRKYDCSATYAMPSIHRDEDVLRVSDEEIREFWKQYLKIKKEGAPFMQTTASIRQIINWPYPYFKILTEKDLKPDKKVRKCAMKDRLILMGGEGELYPCTVKYAQKGLNVRDVGVRKAYETLRELDDCYACSDLSCINLTFISNLSPSIVLETVKTYLKTYLLKKSYE